MILKNQTLKMSYVSKFLLVDPENTKFIHIIY